MLGKHSTTELHYLGPAPFKYPFLLFGNMLLKLFHSVAQAHPKGTM